LITTVNPAAALARSITIPSNIPGNFNCASWAIEIAVRRCPEPLTFLKNSWRTAKIPVKPRWAMCVARAFTVARSNGNVSLITLWNIIQMAITPHALRRGVVDCGG
jgi:hypothetical protein